MIYSTSYTSPLGEIILNADGEHLTALYFAGGKYFERYHQTGEEKKLPIFEETKKWLDLYFSGKKPDFTPKFQIEGITPFRKEVQEEMLKIPYGQVLSYLDIAKHIARKRGLEKMSAQAVGGAVGWNPICIIVPCHRVVGTNHSLTGYSGGIENKVKLLQLEGVDVSKYSIPKKGTAL